MTPEQSRPQGRGWLSPLVHLSNNWISLAGVVLVTTATVFWLFLLPVTLQGETRIPYIGILVFLGLPAPFFAGLILIPLGIWLKRRREGRARHLSARFSAAHLEQPRAAQAGLLRRRHHRSSISSIASQLTYGAVNYMDSVTFCGQTCHTVMQPEYTAYQNSPHSRVECVKCHIGPGAGWFVQEQTLRRRPGVRGDVQHLSRGPSPRRCTTCVPRARPAKRATGRRSTAKTACG